jgi:hypothetical protein
MQLKKDLEELHTELSVAHEIDMLIQITKKEFDESTTIEVLFFFYFRYWGYVKSRPSPKKLCSFIFQNNILSKILCVLENILTNFDLNQNMKFYL